MPADEAVAQPEMCDSSRRCPHHSLDGRRTGEARAGEEGSSMSEETRDGADGTPDDRTALRGQQIHDEGLDGWRKVLDRLVVRFETGDFNTGAALVQRIAEVADEANHHPDVDLRYPHLTVSLRSHDVGAITPRDIRLARRISELAAEAGVRAAAH